MTYCATFSDYAPFDRRPLVRDFLSQAGFAFVSVSFIAAVGACLVYGRPGGTVRVGKAPELAPIKTVAHTPKVQPKLSVALRDVTFSLDFAPLSLNQSAPIGTDFEPVTTATLVARAETKQVPLPAASAAVQTASSSTPVAESGSPIIGSRSAPASNRAADRTNYRVHHAGGPEFLRKSLRAEACRLLRAFGASPRLCQSRGRHFEPAKRPDG
jgi:hypothetical protein